MMRLKPRRALQGVLLGLALAAPLAGLGMSKWLEEFAYKIDLEWWIFGLAGILALLIAFLTTGFQSIKAAMNNPAESLHND